ncbi:MAG TPA: alpha-2-macroglobulin, partial [Pirellulales bacterium]|nr:alpha-2-macroglobulin [Pirellulales bacterium]
KITRTSHTDTWYPSGIWDWFYGKGYWWFAYDYTWYPGWREWGCLRPAPWWIGRGGQPPEVVADADVPIGADGTVSVDIDTAAAKAVHPDQDHSYQITAEVTDDSRRTIVGTGNVLVARKPFQVIVWVDRGYYRAGDGVHAHFAAHTLAGKPVAGKGQLLLYLVSYDKDGKPSEKAVEEWNVDTYDEGQGDQQFKVVAPGQYRLSYKLTDAKKHTIEGGYVFAVAGEKADDASYRFNEIELVPDQREYRPGDKVKLMVNTNREGGIVWLFIRPANGIYQLPKLLRPQRKSEIVEIDVTKKDMPNFFVEALTIADGKVYSDVKEIVVPPEQRVLNLAVQPSRDTYKPGQKATVAVKLTDLAGKPFVGSTVLAIYDKAVEYISGGSNVPDIKEFFWKWRRSHYSYAESNLGRLFYNLLHSGETPMSDLGVF